MSKILTTDNYKTFKLISGNRPVVKRKVEKIIKSYGQGINLFPFCPILINKDHYIIDGQHRLAASKELKIEAHYMIVPDFSLAQIAELNSNTDKWSNKNFMECYIKTGNKHYEKLNSFKEKYGLAINTAANLLNKGTATGGSSGNVLDNFRNGTFEVKEWDRAINTMTHVSDYITVFSEIHDRNFIRCIQMLMACPLYKHKEVVNKISKNGDKIVKQPSHKEYIYHIENLFNKNNSKRQIIFK